MSEDYELKPVMPVRAIKHILEKELEGFYESSLRVLHKESLSDVPYEMMDIARAVLQAKLVNCNDYESLEEYINYAGYRMSLEEWVNSL